MGFFHHILSFILVSLLLLQKIQAAPLLLSSDPTIGAIRNGGSGARPETTTLRELTTSGVDSLYGDNSSEIPEEMDVLMRRRRSITKDDCISNTTTISEAMMKAAQGKKSCEGYDAPVWLFLATVNEHQENLFVTSAVCFFIVVLLYALNHVATGLMSKIFNGLAIIFTAVGYTCTLAMAALHLSAVSTAERYTVLVFTLIVLLLLTLKLLLHVTLSARAKSVRGMNLLCNFVIIPHGPHKGRNATNGFQQETPGVVLLMTRTITAAAGDDDGEYEWKVNGQSHKVKSPMPQPGSLTVYSFFKKVKLVLRSKQESTNGSYSVCLYSTHLMGEPVRVRSSAARSLSRRPDKVQYSALLTPYSDGEDEA